MPIYFTMLRYAPLCSSLQCLPGCVPHLIASPPLSHRLTSGGRTYADNQTPEPSTPVHRAGQREEKLAKEVLIITLVLIIIITLLVKMTYIYCLYFTDHHIHYSHLQFSVLYSMHIVKVGPFCSAVRCHCPALRHFIQIQCLVAGGWWRCSASGSDSE